MLNIRSAHINVNHDRRQAPRLELHCAARIVCLQEKKNRTNGLGPHTLFPEQNKSIVTDLSLGGLFMEVENRTGLEVGRMVDLALTLPTENQDVFLKVAIVSMTQRGIGCHFVNLSQKNDQIIRYCFETFKDTLPLD